MSTVTHTNLSVSTVSSDSNSSSAAPNGTRNETVTDPQHQDGGSSGGYRGIEAVAAVCVVGICAVFIVIAVITGRLERQNPKLEIHVTNEFSNPSYNQPSISNQAMTSL